MSIIARATPLEPHEILWEAMQAAIKVWGKDSPQAQAVENLYAQAARIDADKIAESIVRLP